MRLRQKIMRGSIPMAHAGGCLAMLVATPGSAQEFDAFDSIRERPRPEYAAPPVRVGGFELYPSVAFELAFIDNLFASDALDLDDTLAVVAPSLAVRSQRPDRILNLDVSVAYQNYLEGAASDRVSGNAAAQGRFRRDTATRPFFDLRFARNNGGLRNTGVIDDIAQPLKLTNYGGSAGVAQDFGPLTATVSGRYNAVDFDGDFVFNGVPVAASFRNFQEVGATARLSYSRNPAQRFYVQLSGNKRDYDDRAPDLPDTTSRVFANRTGEGLNASVGYIRRLTELLQIDVNVGYLAQEFDDPALGSISALSFAGNAYYSPTQLTRIRARAARSIDETTNPLFNGLLRTEFALSAEHELRRDIVLGAEGRYTAIDPGEGLENGNEYFISAFVRYFVSPNWSLNSRVERFERDAISPGSQTRALFGVRYDF